MPNTVRKSRKPEIRWVQGRRRRTRPVTDDSEKDFYSGKKLYCQMHSLPTTMAMNAFAPTTYAHGIVLSKGSHRRHPSTTKPESFIRRARRLDAQGRTDAALDLIYDSVDELLRSNQFPEIDAIVARVAVEDCSTDILLGLLTATLPARTKLLLRKHFFWAVDRNLKTRPEYEGGLLAGLE
jgi:hypothetical protein